MRRFRHSLISTAAASHPHAILRSRLLTDLLLTPVAPRLISSAMLHYTFAYQISNDVDYLISLARVVSEQTISDSRHLADC